MIEFGRYSREPALSVGNHLLLCYFHVWAWKGAWAGLSCFDHQLQFDLQEISIIGVTKEQVHLTLTHKKHNRCSPKVIMSYFPQAEMSHIQDKPLKFVSDL
jgi:hypothetical protein